MMGKAQTNRQEAPCWTKPTQFQRLKTEIRLRDIQVNPTLCCFTLWTTPSHKGCWNRTKASGSVRTVAERRWFSGGSWILLFWFALIFWRGDLDLDLGQVIFALHEADPSSIPSPIESLWTMTELTPEHWQLVIAQNSKIFKNLY